MPAGGYQANSGSAPLSEHDAPLDRGGVERCEQRLVGLDLRLVRLTREPAEDLVSASGPDFTVFPGRSCSR